MYTYRRKIKVEGKTAHLGGAQLSKPTEIAAHFIIHNEETGEMIRLWHLEKPDAEPSDLGLLNPGECACFLLNRGMAGHPDPSFLALLASVENQTRDCFVVCSIAIPQGR